MRGIWNCVSDRRTHFTRHIRTPASVRRVVKRNQDRACKRLTVELALFTYRCFTAIESPIAISRSR